jgi:hypothetical protein
MAAKRHRTGRFSPLSVRLMASSGASPTLYRVACERGFLDVLRSVQRPQYRGAA